MNKAPKGLVARTVLAEQVGFEPTVRHNRTPDFESSRAALRQVFARANSMRSHWYLSTQALEIVRRNVQGKKPEQPLFPSRQAPRTLAAICEAAGVVRRSPHELRKTFSSLAQSLVSVYTLKAMMNHASGGDVTGEFYIAVDESQLRLGWQTVADYIEQLAKKASIVESQDF